MLVLDIMFTMLLFVSLLLFRARALLVVLAGDEGDVGAVAVVVVALLLEVVFVVPPLAVVVPPSLAVVDVVAPPVVVDVSMPAGVVLISCAISESGSKCQFI